MSCKMLIFGTGYSANFIARSLIAKGWQVYGTVRKPEAADQLASQGITPIVFDGETVSEPLLAVLDQVTHILNSIPPGRSGDPVLRLLGAKLAALAPLHWVGYLSTTGVYGTRDGGVVDEDSERRPTSARSRARVAAEDGWLDLSRSKGVPVHIFRLAGIYGPGRSVFDTIRSGALKRIEQPGQKFSRIHVEDIAGVVEASIGKPRAGAIYNLCDDHPLEPSLVSSFACELLGLPVPPAEPFEVAAKSMSEMALTFWQDNKIVDNSRLKSELGYQLRYPDHQSGLRAILQAEIDQGKGLSVDE